MRLFRLNRSDRSARRRRDAGAAIVLAAACACLAAAAGASVRGVPVPHRPRLDGELTLRLRSRVEDPVTGERLVPVVRTVDWQASETAIIVCDMWDDHYCRKPVERLNALVPRLNETLSAARRRGVLIVHAPSGMTGFCSGTPHRRRMQQAPRVEPPIRLLEWCDLDPTVEGPLPIDTSRGRCDDAVVTPTDGRRTRQHAGLDITGHDGVSDDISEIYSVFRRLGIWNVIVTSVHTNMCVLGRSFGIRQLVRLGFNVALVRDLTDAMYDSREPPYVSHECGSELVVEHIETYWCPSLASDDLCREHGGRAAGPRTR